MPFIAGGISAGTAAAISAGAGVVSAGIGAISSMSAAGKASSAAGKAADLQGQQVAQTREDLLPYNTAGQSVLGDLTALSRSGPYGGGKNYLQMAEDNLPGRMTQAELEATPGYQFNLAQGLKATQSAAAARGLGVSGAALKGAATYATGLADSTYQNQFNNAQTRYSDIFNLNTGQQSNLQNQYNRLLGTATLGEAAAAGTATANTAATKNEGQALMAQGQYGAAGTQGIGNALQGGINSYLGQQALRQGTAMTGGYTGADAQRFTIGPGEGAVAA